MEINLRELSHYTSYFVSTRFLGRRRPLVGGINITSECDLKCRHCPYSSPDYPAESLTREQIEKIVEGFLSDDIHILFLQGGEPSLWRDGGYTFDDLVHDMKERFFRVACVTNATRPITAPADLVWVSVDGPPRVHDEVRGTGSYAKMERNVRGSENPNLYANITLSRINVDSLEEAVENIVDNMPQFRGISFNFQIPYPGVEGMSLDYAERSHAAARILGLKDRGYPILNSAAGLETMLRPGWNKTHWLIRLGHPDGTVVDGCGVREIDPSVCEYCGYGVMAEAQAIYRGRLSSIREALRLFRLVGTRPARRKELHGGRASA